MLYINFKRITYWKQIIQIKFICHAGIWSRDLRIQSQASYTLNHGDRQIIKENHTYHRLFLKLLNIQLFSFIQTVSKKIKYYRKGKAKCTKLIVTTSTYKYVQTFPLMLTSQWLCWHCVSVSRSHPDVSSIPRLAKSSITTHAISSAYAMVIWWY